MGVHLELLSQVLADRIMYCRRTRIPEDQLWQVAARMHVTDYVHEELFQIESESVTLENMGDTLADWE